jgi:hypothetical protein
LWEEDSIWLGKARSTVDLTPGLIVITIAPICISIRGYTSAHSLFHSGGRVFPRGGRTVHLRYCVLEGNNIPNSLELWHGGFLSPDLQFGSGFQQFGSYILGGRIIGLFQLGGRICHWRHYGLGVFQLIYCSETSHTFLPSSDLPSHGVLQCFEAIREEAVLPLIYSSQDLRIVRERASHIAEGIHWIAVLLGLHLGEAFGSLDLLLSCILEA